MAVTVADAIGPTVGTRPGRPGPVDGPADGSVVDVACADPSAVVDRLRRARRLRLRGPGLDDVPVERPRQCVDDADWLAAVAPTLLAVAGEHGLAVRLAAALLAATTVGGDPPRLSAAGRRVQEALVAHTDDRGHRRPVEEPGRVRRTEALGVMVKAVADDDAAAFVAGADLLLGGVVTLLDTGGHVLARSRPTEQVPATRTPRSMLLGGEGRLTGTLELPGTGWWSSEEETVLRHLAGSVLQRRALLDEVRDLRHRMAVATWLGSEVPLDEGGRSGLGSLSPRPRIARCRPVVVSLPEDLDERSVRVVEERITRACAAHASLATATLIHAGDTLIGVYTAGRAGAPQAEAESWEAVLAAVPVPGLAVSIGREACAGDALRSSFAAASAVAQLQRHGAAYLDLPTVAVGEQLAASADVLVAVTSGQVPFVIERVLGRLLTDDRFGGELVETLYAYLVTRGSPQEAGRLLHLHVSSVKYRMRVIRELLGVRLDDPAQRFELELAARLYLAAREFGPRPGDHAERGRRQDSRD